MSTKTNHLSDDLHAYVVAHSLPQDQVLLDLAAETQRRLPRQAGMQIAPEQGAFLTILTRIVGVRYAVEVGTFTGYSSICIARGLVPQGRLLCCDVSDEYTSVAREYWQRAGLADRIELRLGPGVETLRALPADPPIDLAFIDADKPGYPDYWNEIVPRLRPGGVILADNTLGGGRVLDPDSEFGQAIAQFNKLALADDRVELVLLPIGDGLTLARKR